MSSGELSKKLRIVFYFDPMANDMLIKLVNISEAEGTETATALSHPWPTSSSRVEPPAKT